ncbi:XrtA/PEP-CTERM system histidine kinase PrsK [uncultured Sphingomonas sp.]|uniref:XrtA/PEP-CTERM system histidine kinase PrsK n=1 Tax=uncultured Sphingomonas sp. TaxID=158754 RepID=UPI0035CA5180
MTLTLILWAHALASLIFAMLAFYHRRRGAVRGVVAALALTALWALTVAGIGVGDVAALLTEAARDLAWLWVAAVLGRRGDTLGMARSAAFAAATCLPIALAAVVLARAVDAAAQAPSIAFSIWSLRLLIALAGLILLFGATPAQGPARIAAALAMLWGVDLFVLAAAPAAGSPDTLILARGVGTVAAGAAFALANAPRADRGFRVSPALRLRMLAGGALLAYLAAVVAATDLADAFVGAHARAVQTAIVVVAAATLAMLAFTSWLRAWTRVVVEKHLFRHRYDYRTAWRRFTDTLRRPGEDRPLGSRIVQATADLVDAPAGLLLATDDHRLLAAEEWRWHGDIGDASETLARHLAATGRIIELDRVRDGSAPECDRAGVPAWMIDDSRSWALVPLVHVGSLVGAILLARPPVARSLDWEDIDLLRVCGAQAASYLAEERAHAALADAERFDEFNRRFAFILHDIKNLGSQLTLVARNAERHADNPAFRVDMVATLTESADRMTALIARLLCDPAPAERGALVDLAVLAARAVEQGRGGHAVEVATDGPVLAMADAAGLLQALAHLVRNAVEAGPADAPVLVSVASAGNDAVIEVADRGCGMSPGFVRDHLFRPFSSSKPRGFGLGAHEARRLVRAMGGMLDVDSREGAGTRFRITLPAALERAA